VNTEEEVLRGIEIEEEVENVIEQHIRDKQVLQEKYEQTLSQKDQEIEDLKALLKNRQ